MTPEQLKASILQYAIQGKLVEQRPEEGTGEELYRQIQKEKQRLIKEGKIKKEKDLPQIAEDEIPFDIPESWKWCRLGALTYNWGQKTPDNRFCYVDVGSVNNISHTLNSENTVVEAKDASSRAKKIVKYGDVIFATIRPYLKNICIIDREFPYEPIVSTAFAVMHCPEGLLNKYLYFYLLSPTFMSFANARDKAKGVAYPAIGEKDFFNGIIALPPLTEQKRIVAKIEELLPYVDRYAAAYEKLEHFNAKFPEDMKKSILQYAIQGKLVEQRPEEGTGEELLKLLYAEKEKIIKSGVLKGRKTKPLQSVSPDDAPFEIPDTWCWVRLGTVAEIFGRIGFRGYTKNDIVSAGEGAITISPSNIRPNGKTDFSDCTYLSWEKYEESPEIKVFNGDILLVKTGSSYGKCGIVCDLPEKATINPQLAILKYITCEVKYLDYVLKSPMARNQFESFVIGTSIPTFSQEKLANLLLPLPPLAEQKRIVAKIEELLPLCERLK